MDWIAGHHRPGEPLPVVVVCTGNSRRSMLGAMMGNAAAAYHGLPEVRFFSAGTTPSAFNPRTVAALKAVGFEVEPSEQLQNAALRGVGLWTAGIGEHAAEVRARVCRDAAWLGITLDDEVNRRGGPRISTGARPSSVWVISTDEERMIAEHTLRLIRSRLGPR